MTAIYQPQITATNDGLSIPFVAADLRLAGLLDRRMIDLLRAIDSTGSINQAAKLQGLSYKGAWQIIERANNGAPQILISTAIGGSRGGGTRLTEAGLKLVALFEQLEQQHQAFIGQLNRQLANYPDTLLLLQRMAVKCSSRNQLFGEITAIIPGAVNAEVLVKLKNQHCISVSVGMAQVADMALALGAQAWLLIDAASIVLEVDDGRYRYSARNQLPCTVIRIQQDEIEAEVIVTLEGGELLAVSITRESLDRLELAPGQTRRVIFKRNAAILGVAAG